MGLYNIIGKNTFQQNTDQTRQNVIFLYKRERIYCILMTAMVSGGVGMSGFIEVGYQRTLQNDHSADTYRSAT